MFYVKDDNGTRVPLDCNNIYTICPKCEREHQASPEDFAFCQEENGELWCEACSAQTNSGEKPPARPHLQLIRGKE